MVQLKRTFLVVIAAGLALFLVSCGGSNSSPASSPVATSASSPAQRLETSPTLVPPTTATLTPATAPAATSASSSTTRDTAPTASKPTTSSSSSSPTGGSTGAITQQDLIARGKVIFEKEAGGVGCQLCHGMDAKGLKGPGINIRGKTAEEIRNALQTVEMMMQAVKNLSPEDIDAVAAYLKWLTTQP